MAGVTIEPLDEDHFALAAKWLSDPDINRWLYAEWRGRAVDERLVAIVAANKRNRLFMVRTGGDAVGLVALGEINELDRSASLWYVLGEKVSASRGLTTQAVGLVVGFAFESLKLHSIHASVVDTNVGSRRVLEKNEFARCGCIRQGFLLDGAFRDRLIFDRVNMGA
jgi:ribosomal-protein-alanine N-acetyltransferase